MVAHTRVKSKFWGTGGEWTRKERLLQYQKSLRKEKFHEIGGQCEKEPIPEEACSDTFRTGDGRGKKVYQTREVYPERPAKTGSGYECSGPDVEVECHATDFCEPLMVGTGNQKEREKQADTAIYQTGKLEKGRGKTSGLIVWGRMTLKGSSIKRGWKSKF